LERNDTNVQTVDELFAVFNLSERCIRRYSQATYVPLNQEGTHQKQTAKNIRPPTRSVLNLLSTDWVAYLAIVSNSSCRTGERLTPSLRSVERGCLFEEADSRLTLQSNDEWRVVKVDE
jgi:hypothetical protein